MSANTAFETCFVQRSNIAVLNQPREALGPPRRSAVKEMLAFPHADWNRAAEESFALGVYRPA